MSFPRYPKYKDSGVDWLGQVPDHWEVAPFKRQIERNDGGVWGDDPDGLNDTIVLRSTEQTVDGRWQLEDPAPRKLTANDITGSLLIEGDLLLTKSSGSSLHIGKTTLVTPEIAAMRCCYSNFMQRIRTKPSFCPKLAWHVLNNDLARRQFDLLSNSTTGLANLNGTMIGQILVPVPPLAEQVLIAAFLDRETAKIDALVAEQQRLIELLRGKRQAVISHAVTKGLNPNAPMKPSGIEWLGDVPEQWQVAPAGYRYEVQLGKMLDSTKITGEHLRPYLRVFDVQWGDINIEGLPQMDFDAEARQKFQLLPGDLLVNEGGSYPGRSAIWSGQIDECYYQKALHRMRPHRPKEDATRFIYYVMSWAANHGVFTAGGNEATIEHLPAEKLRRYRFPFPSMTEQLAIADFLDTELSELDTLTAEAQRAINLLQERRTALISAAVSGQIDVRNH